MKRLNPRPAVTLKLLVPVLFVAGAHAAPARIPPAEQGQDVGSNIPKIATEALRSAVDDDRSRAFYEANGWKAVWSDAAVRALEQSLAKRDRHGLDRVDFLTNASGTAAKREVALTRAALRYAAALDHGIANPAELHAIYTIPRPQTDLGKPLADAIAQGKLTSWLASLAPQDDAYSRLSRAYLKAVKADAKSTPRKIGDGIIRVGDADSRVRAVVKALRDEGYLATSEAADESHKAGLGTPESTSGDNGAQHAKDAAPYTRRISDAVRELQRDYGINADGIVGPDTLEVLNLRPGDRARQLAIGLERLRWLSRTPPVTRIDVNTAAATLSYYRDGERVDKRRAIVGKPGKETPSLRAPIFRLVANPTWTIPRSIQHGELANVGHAYLRRHHMVWRDGWIVQKPGSDNALGLVKFDMKDGQAIYLHDTSARQLFDRSQRHLSHGCVRVEDATGLAKRIAQDAGIAEKWKEARASGGETFVDLPEALPVRLLYHNVFVGDDGEIAYRTDPYGWNPPIAKALGFPEVSKVRANADAVDIGP